MTEVRAEYTEDESGSFAPGKRGDTLVFCTNCSSPSPVIAIKMTRNGPDLHYQRYHPGEIHILPTAVQIHCQSCNAWVCMTWPDVYLALGEDPQRAK